MKERRREFQLQRQRNLQNRRAPTLDTLPRPGPSLPIRASEVETIISQVPAVQVSIFLISNEFNKIY